MPGSDARELITLAMLGAGFEARYPVAFKALNALAEDASVTPEVYVQVCEAVFDVADRHTDHEPGPPRSEWPRQEGP